MMVLQGKGVKMEESVMATKYSRPVVETERIRAHNELCALAYSMFMVC